MEGFCGHKENRLSSWRTYVTSILPAVIIIISEVYRKVLYPDGSQRESQKTSQIAGKKPSFRSTWRISWLIFCFPRTASRCQWEITHTSGEWNIGVKTYHGARKRGIFLLIHLKTVSARLGYWKWQLLNSHLQAWHTRFNVKSETQHCYTRWKISWGASSRKNWNLASFLLPDMPQSRSFHF